MDDDEKDQSLASETDSTPSYVPSSLASFVARAQATLDDVQSSLQHLDSPAKSSIGNSASVSMDHDTSFPSMREDEDDKKLKQEVMDKLDQKSQIIEEEDTKEESFLMETANLLLALDDEGEVTTHEPSPIKAVDTSLEGVDFAMAELLTLDGFSAPPVKSQNQSAVQNDSPSVDTETKRDSGSSRASGWRNLIASAPSKNENMPPKPPAKARTEVAGMSTSAAKSVDKSQVSPAVGRDVTPKSAPMKASGPSIKGYASMPKDTIISPSIPATVDPMAMSAALEATSPLAVDPDSNHSLSASTPELTSWSPWKKTFGRMVARLEDRVTPPTSEHSTPSPVTAKQSLSSKDPEAIAVSTENVKPSQVVPECSPPLSRQSVPSSQVELSDKMLLPAASLEKARRLDSLPPQSTEKNEVIISHAASLPKSPPQVARQSGLVLSLSDSLPEASPQTARQKGLILSPSASLPKASPQASEKSGLFSPPAVTASAQLPIQSGLVLSPLGSLPAPSPSRAEKKSSQVTSPPSVVKSEPASSSASSLPPQSTGASAQILSSGAFSPLRTSAVQSQQKSTPTTPLSKASPHSAAKSVQTTSPAASMQKASSESAAKSVKMSSPASLPKVSPQSALIGSQKSPPPPVSRSSKTRPSPAAKGGQPSPQTTSLHRASSRSAAKNDVLSSPAASGPKSFPKSAERTSSSIVEKSGVPVNVVKNETAMPQSSSANASPPKPVEKNTIEPPRRTKAFVDGAAMQRATVVSSPRKSVSSSPPVPITTCSPRKPEKTAKEPVGAKTAPATTSRASTDDDAFLPNNRSLVAASSPTRRPVQTSKSEASKRVTQSKTSLNAQPNQRKSLPVTRKSVDRTTMPSSTSRTAVSRKPTSTPSTGSRLFQRTPSSQAHAKATVSSSSKPPPRTTTTPSRLTGGTASSEARAKIVSPTSKPIASTTYKAPLAAVGDGREKARERVRQQKLVEEKKRKDAALAAEKQASRSRTRGTTFTAEEGRALARERVKRQQAAGTVQPAGAPGLNGKENRVRPSNSTASGSVRSSRRAPTIPKSPDFATKAVMGDKPRARSTLDNSMKLDPNPISRALGSPTHSDRIKGSTARTSTGSSCSRRLTIPKAPRLSTTAKYGDKPPPSVREKKPLKHVSQPKPLPRKREFKATQPVPFKFHSSKACASMPPAGKEAEPCLAEQVQLYSRKGLREETPFVPSTKRAFKPTIPKSPHFSAISHREMPKSTAEMEEEVMEYYKTHPFKAAPIGVDAVVGTGPRKQAPKRRLTQPVPFHFRADERAAHYETPTGSPDPEAKDLEECKKQFHARPLPRMPYNPPPRKESVPRALTTPKPFSLATERRAAKSEPRGPSADEVEQSKQFHARPIPKSTYVVPKSRPRSVVVQPAATPRHYAGPPKLATSARTEPREASRLASERNAEQMARQREELALRKKREKHQEDMAKACLSSPTLNIKPFHLQSEERHRAYQQHLAEQLALEEEEKKQNMLFTAKPIRISDPPAPIHSARPATTPRPFALQSVSRHEHCQEERRQQLEAEERERQRLMNVKAMPLPGTTYKCSPVTPAPQKKRNDGNESEERDLDSARKRAMEALKTAESEMIGDVKIQGRSLLGSLMGS